MKKRTLSPSVFLAIKIKRNIQYMYKQKCCEEKHVDLLLIGENERDTMFLSNILTLSCMIILYIVKENIFVVIVYKLVVQKKYLNVILKTALKLMVSKKL